MTDLTDMTYGELCRECEELKRQIRIGWRAVTPLKKELVWVTAEIVARQNSMLKRRVA